MLYQFQTHSWEMSSPEYSPASNGYTLALCACSRRLLLDMPRAHHTEQSLSYSAELASVQYLPRPDALRHQRRPSFQYGTLLFLHLVYYNTPKRAPDPMCDQEKKQHMLLQKESSLPSQVLPPRQSCFVPAHPFQ